MVLNRKGFGVASVGLRIFTRGAAAPAAPAAPAPTPMAAAVATPVAAPAAGGSVSVGQKHWHKQLEVFTDQGLVSSRALKVACMQEVIAHPK
eukprot:6411645-Amphidinium_carterae.2